MIWDHIITHLADSDCTEASSISRAANNNNKKKYYLNIHNSDDYLTEREKECVDHLILGKTIKETAKLMNLSPRTVEFYLKNIRKRLDCQTKGQLIEKVQKAYQKQKKPQPIPSD